MKLTGNTYKKIKYRYLLYLVDDYESGKYDYYTYLNDCQINYGTGTGFDIFASSYSDNISFSISSKVSRFYENDYVKLIVYSYDKNGDIQGLVYENNFFLEMPSENGEVISYTAYDYMRKYEIPFPPEYTTSGNSSITSSTRLNCYDILKNIQENYDVPNLPESFMNSLHSNNAYIAPYYVDLSSMSVRNLIENLKLYFLNSIMSVKTLQIDYKDFILKESITTDTSYVKVDYIRWITKVLVSRSKIFPKVTLTDTGDIITPFTTFSAEMEQIEIRVNSDYVGYYTTDGTLISGTDISGDNYISYNTDFNFTQGQAGDYTLLIESKMKLVGDNPSTYDDVANLEWEEESSTITFKEFDSQSTITNFQSRIDFLNSYELKQVSFDCIGTFDFDVQDMIEVYDGENIKFRTICCYVNQSYDGGLKTSISSGSITTTTTTTSSTISTGVSCGYGTSRLADFSRKVDSLEEFFEKIKSEYVTKYEIPQILASIDYVTILSPFLKNIQSETITTDYLKASKAHLDWATILSGTITNTMIYDSTISGSKIDFSTFSNGVISGTAIDSSTFEDGTISGSKITDSTLSGAKITDATIDFEKVGTSFITNLVADSTFISNLQAEMATFGYITANQADIAYAKIDMANVTKATIGTVLADVGLITSATITDGHVTGTLDSVSINANSIKAGTLSVDRLVINGTTSSIIYALNNIGSLTSTHCDTLDGGLITKRTITADRIVASAITANEIHSDAITADKILANTITANKINMSDLVANTAFINAISTNSIVVSANTNASNALSTANNLNAIASKSYMFGGANISANWVRLGTLTSAGDFSNFVIDVKTGGGSNGIESQNSSIEIVIKDGWQSSYSATGAFGVSVTMQNCETAKVSVRASAYNVCEVWCYLPWGWWNGTYTISGKYTSWNPNTTNQTEKPTNGTEQSIGYRMNAENANANADGIKTNIYSTNTTTINGGKITTGTILADSIASNAITSAKIASNAITSAKIASGSITTDKLAANAVTAEKINVSNLFAQDIVATGTITSPILKSSDYVYNGGGYASSGMLVDLKNAKIINSYISISNNGVSASYISANQLKLYYITSSGSGQGCTAVRDRNATEYSSCTSISYYGSTIVASKTWNDYEVYKGKVSLGHIILSPVANNVTNNVSNNSIALITSGGVYTYINDNFAKKSWTKILSATASTGSLTLSSAYTNFSEIKIVENAQLNNINYASENTIQVSAIVSTYHYITSVFHGMDYHSASEVIFSSLTKVTVNQCSKVGFSSRSIEIYGK